MSVPHAEPRRGSEVRSALPFQRRNPLIQARGEAEGALGPAVSHKVPLELCVKSVQTSVHAPGKGVFASAAKQLPLLKMLLVNHDLITL